VRLTLPPEAISKNEVSHTGQVGLSIRPARTLYIQTVTPLEMERLCEQPIEDRQLWQMIHPQAYSTPIEEARNACLRPQTREYIPIFVVVLIVP
jgi:hypothetical protein